MRDLKNGGIWVIPTDTIYGIVGSALNSKTVEGIYQLRKRSLDKPFIILISSIKDLEMFGIKLTQHQRDFLQSHWPNPLSVILPISSKNFEYLHRGTESLAFRMPKDEKLTELLKQTGPLVAPSANFEGRKPSQTLAEAKKYFGNRVDYYHDSGRISAKPSTLIKLEKNGKFKILREGSFKLN
ncbi:MAG: L-threonylcarbamoyladenylate synthase [Candidatus Daviesbacteria bacterium]|nr:L-threonylcarbamoyladenylate synthase [Candidatus Daviesbacteria bacterium]